MMIYLGQPGSGERMPIEMTGVFTDQGVVNEQTVESLWCSGRSSASKTTIVTSSSYTSRPLKGKSNWRFALSTRASSNLGNL